MNTYIINLDPFSFAFEMVLKKTTTNLPQLMRLINAFAVA